jgi:hypothetical protein
MDESIDVGALDMESLLYFVTWEVFLGLSDSRLFSISSQYFLLSNRLVQALRPFIFDFSPFSLIPA